MQIGFLYKGEWSSSLTKLFTGSTCYHVFLTDGVNCWDMHRMRRRRAWPGLYNPAKVILVDTPVPLTADYLNARLASDKSWYGWRDYVLFGLRWFYHLVGQSTRNYGGIICSEMIADDFADCGWGVRFTEVPSPADLERELLGCIDAINSPRWQSSAQEGPIP